MLKKIIFITMLLVICNGFSENRETPTFEDNCNYVKKNLNTNVTNEARKEIVGALAKKSEGVIAAVFLCGSKELQVSSLKMALKNTYHFYPKRMPALLKAAKKHSPYYDSIKESLVELERKVNITHEHVENAIMEKLEIHYAMQRVCDNDIEKKFAVIEALPRKEISFADLEVLLIRSGIYNCGGIERKINKLLESYPEHIKDSEL